MKKAYSLCWFLPTIYWFDAKVTEEDRHYYDDMSDGEIMSCNNDMLCGDIQDKRDAFKALFNSKNWDFGWCERHMKIISFIGVMIALVLGRGYKKNDKEYSIKHPYYSYEKVISFNIRSDGYGYYYSALEFCPATCRYYLFNDGESTY